MKSEDENFKNFAIRIWDSTCALISPNSWDASELLDLLKAAHWEKITSFIESKPYSMFARVNDGDGSPLQYSV